jgi:hypothetical protein
MTFSPFSQCAHVLILFRTNVLQTPLSSQNKSSSCDNNLPRIKGKQILRGFIKFVTTKNILVPKPGTNRMTTREMTNLIFNSKFIILKETKKIQEVANHFGYFKKNLVSPVKNCIFGNALKIRFLDKLLSGVPNFW